jgi:hypothetical protein
MLIRRRDPILNGRPNLFLMILGALFAPSPATAAQRARRHARSMAARRRIYPSSVIGTVLPAPGSLLSRTARDLISPVPNVIRSLRYPHLND